MKVHVRKLKGFPKKLKATRVKFEHRVGPSNHMTLVLYNTTVASATKVFERCCDLSIGSLVITAVYGELRIYTHECRISDILQETQQEMLLY